MSEEYDILIEQYLSGEMSDNEKVNFLNQLKSNAQLKSAFEEAKAAYVLVLTSGKDDLKRKLAAFESEYSIENPKVVPLRVKLAAAAAIILITLLGIRYWLPSDSNSDKLFAQHFQVYDSPSVVRDTPSDSQVNWNKAREYYKNKSYTSAVQSFKAAEDEVPVYLTRFYSGISFMAADKPSYEAAINEFNAVLQTENDFTQQANWYKGLCLLKLGKKSDAKEIFAAIVAQKGYKFKTAEKILNALSN